MKKQLGGILLALMLVASCASSAMAITTDPTEPPIVADEVEDAVSTSVKSEYVQVLTVEEDGFAHDQSLYCEQVDTFYARSGLIIPANTTVYIAKANIISSVDVSVDCASAIYYGISQGMEYPAQLETQVTEGSSIETFTPKETGFYYVYLRNETDKDVSAGIVITMNEWIQTSRAYAEEHAIYVHHSGS